MVGLKLHRFTACAAAFALIAAAAVGLPCLAMPSAADHDCCPPAAGFAASPLGCCDGQTESPSSPVTLSSVGAPSAHSLLSDMAPPALPALVPRVATRFPYATSVLRI